jgi:hypothetical protein
VTNEVIRQYDDESPLARRWTKRGQPSKGVSRAGMSTKFHVAITTVVEGFLSGGNVNDIKAAEELGTGVVGCFVIADRGYDRGEFRRLHTRAEKPEASDSV